MIAIGDDKETIYITRGDTPQDKFNKIAFEFPIYNVKTQKEELYEFQLDDKISFVVFEKKGYTKKEIFRKDYKIKDIGYTDPTTTPEIVLTEEETKMFPLFNKKQTYWYDLVLNDTTTMLGMDEEGAKKIIVYPEADEE
mgnify:CR=1 FL=1